MKTHQKIKVFVVSILIIALTFIALKVQAQSNVSFSLHQDARLLILGDDHGNAALTPNILARFQMNGNQDKHGYFTASPSFEYAAIDGNYYRYSAEIGYTFNQTFKNWEHSANINWGWIDRYGKSFFSSGATGEIAYILNDKFKISLLAQLTERKDLLYLWGDYVWRVSGFVGLTYNIN